MALTRRQFLRWVSLAGFGSWTACSAERIRPTSASLRRARVVVIGGGFAGASAAKALKLFSPDLQVTLVERDRSYLACPGSNLVIAGLRPAEQQRHDPTVLADGYGINCVTGTVAGIDADRREVRLGDGNPIRYDRLIVAPGIDFRWNALEGYDAAISEVIPHAWKAGPQTDLLRRQLLAMADGGVVLITVPANPYRCPPGPYERASLIAYYLAQYKPRSKVLVLDAKTKFSKQAAFMEAWRELYPGRIEWISAEREGGIDGIDGRRRIVHTHFDDFRADVLNVIPPQRAGALAQVADLVDEGGWCPVDLRSFESTRVPRVHVIGDACRAEPMPKSAFAAHSQARTCAAAVVDLLAGRAAESPRLLNHCYSFVGPGEAISITGVYGEATDPPGLSALHVAETPPDADRRLEGEHARDWERQFLREVFS